MQNLVEIPAPDFDLAKTLDSGQVFHWERAEPGFVGTIGDLAVYLNQAGDTLQTSGNAQDLECLKHSRLEQLVANYFALDHPLGEICASFPNDQAMIAAREFCRGLRIIRQPKWECLATFICSSMKQVAHIRQISRKLRERFGEARKIAGRTVYTFPSPESVASSSDRELRKCALGYRAKNLLSTARQVASGGLDLEKLAKLADADLRASLCQLPGVGAKVANCVMLFAYERLRAFPIDVWIERVLREKYFPRARKLNAARLRAFTEEYFGEHGGYAQQYLFHHARMNKTSKMERRAQSRPRKRRTTQRSSLHDKGARVR
ncbi:MAG TPA: DNA glycosylase [Chthoniobacterales bacterium]|nr:DNA glycosylase [Chthoniobacterales bacterium]